MKRTNKQKSVGLFQFAYIVPYLKHAKFTGVLIRQTKKEDCMQNDLVESDQEGLKLDYNSKENNEWL